MTISRGALPRRRPPPPSATERYRGYVRASRRRRARLPGGPLARATWPIVILLALASTAATVVTVERGAASLIRDLEEALGRAFPAAITAPLELEHAAPSVLVDPVIDELPPFTRTPSVLLQGHVPTFAVTAQRRVEITLNGAVVARPGLDHAGRFAQELTLRDGDNIVVITLLDDATRLASIAATTVLDTAAPALAITRPTTGETLEAETVIVDGKTEPGARVTVNARVVVPAPDGTFSEAFTAPAGAVRIEVIAIDRAGNETKAALSVNVAPR